MLKKIILIMMLVVLTASPVLAEQNVTVIINNEAVDFDVPPQLINSRTMVPMRKIFETLGAGVEWHGESQLIIATKNELIITMTIGDEKMNVTNVISGETKVIILDSVPVLINGRTLVPARAISESLGYNVAWLEDTRTVEITEADKL